MEPGPDDQQADNTEIKLNEDLLSLGKEPSQPDDLLLKDEEMKIKSDEDLISIG